VITADNHNGWVVEELVAGEGWVVVFGPEPDRDYVRGYCIGLKEMMQQNEYRVYEALTVKESK
jgi:hypothetical protein